MKPLTVEQRRLAELNHALVYKFLNENDLPETEFYDVVIFGYLCAAQEYCENPDLQKYSFSTVAWKRMRRELSNHIKFLERKKRDFPTVSFSDLIGCTEDYARNESMLLEEISYNLLLHSLAAKITQKQMRIIRMKLDGYRMHDIAKAERMTFKDINRILEDAAVCIRNLI